MNLSRCERETIINFNQEDPIAYIYTRFVASRQTYRPGFAAFAATGPDGGRLTGSSLPTHPSVAAAKLPADRPESQ